MLLLALLMPLGNLINDARLVTGSDITVTVASLLDTYMPGICVGQARCGSRVAHTDNANFRNALAQALGPISAQNVSKLARTNTSVIDSKRCSLYRPLQPVRSTEHDEYVYTNSSLLLGSGRGSAVTAVDMCLFATRHKWPTLHLCDLAPCAANWRCVRTITLPPVCVSAISPVPTPASNAPLVLVVVVLSGITALICVLAVTTAPPY